MNSCVGDHAVRVYIRRAQLVGEQQLYIDTRPRYDELGNNISRVESKKEIVAYLSWLGNNN
jgi:hypothetical protein